MQILIVTAVFYPEPIVMSTITKDLAEILAQEHTVTVATPYPCRPYGYKLPPTIDDPTWPFKRVVLNSYTHPQSSIIGRFRENFSFGRAICKYINAHHDQIDVIYMNVFPLFAQRKIIKCASYHHIPVVNHIEDIYPEPLLSKIPLFGKLVYKLLLPIDKWIVQHATYSIVIGKQIRAFFIRTRNADPNKIKVVYNWQDETRFTQLSSVPQSDTFTFMYVGSISPAANLHHILQRFAQANVPNAQLVFAGAGTEKEALKMRSAQYPNAKINFIDAPADKIAELQNRADVLILPLKPQVSLQAVPSKLPAYLFTKKPVLACVEMESDVAEIIHTGQCGWIVAPDDDLALMNQLQMIRKIDAQILQKMGQAGFDYALKHLTKATNLKQLAQIVISATN